MATGSGNTLGEALLAAALQLGGRPRLKSYTAKSWHPQIVKIVASPRGYAAANLVGLTASKRTVLAWLANEVTPNKENQAKIQAAYDVMAGKFPSEMTYAEYRITGQVTLGDDSRHRGGLDSAPLLIDGSAGTWGPIRSAWNSGHMTPEDFERLFIEHVIVEDLGEGSEPWMFDGSDYDVEIA